VTDELLNVAMHPALVAAFKEWLEGRGLRLGKVPGEDFYIVTFTQETWDSMLADQGIRLQNPPESP
jgi:hypothetical protein